MIEATSKIPKYSQITQDIIYQIQKGELPPHSQAPSENEIIDAYRVSNTTARKALQELSNAGWVKRIKGKGTYVLERKIERSASRILGFTKNMIEAGRQPSTRLISLQVMQPPFTMTINSRDYTLKGPLCKIQRLRFGDDAPIMFETRYISMRFCPEIDKKDLERSLYEIYEKDYGLRLNEIQQVLGVIMLDNHLMDYFDLQSPAPAFRVEGATFCGKGLILEMEESIYRGDMYRFTVAAKQ
ncbi:MAG: GntR family transcriptional regulator [Candidatus Omnitrophica bacterium]|nr:GntR family transcriptional regulator [Candidatus Omnitrophota bacterium]